jgi:SAM-dependent methyltransferase
VSAPARLGHPADALAEARAATPPRLRSACGRVLPLHVDRWFADPSAAEHDVLERVLAPVLDVGCGPARHTLALLDKGVPAVGVDASSGAVRIARGRGAPVLHRSVFDRLPDEGRWGTALLLDGNVGIGGRPVALLRRLRAALRPGGRVLVEVERPGTRSGFLRVRIEAAPRAVAPDAVHGWFPWATVGADALPAVARRAGLSLVELWAADGRWFGRLDA